MNPFKYILVSLAIISTQNMNAEQKRGVDRANLDTSVAPQTDFYDYACGGWMKANPLKPEFARYGTFDELRENNRIQLRELIMNLDTKNSPEGSIAQKIGDLYEMGLDSLRLNIEGSQPIIGDVVAINQTPKSDVIDLLATKVGVDGFFATGVEADMMNSDVNAMYWSQGGMGLGDRDYYLEDSDNAKKIRDAYRTYIMTLTRLIGYDTEAQKRTADNVMEIETRLAKAAMSREELRDPAATYNPMTLDEIAEKYPYVDLRRYFAKQGITDIESVIIGQPNSLAEINAILAEASEQAIHDYLTVSYVSTAADYLSDDFTDAKFKLSQAVSGVEEPMPRWKRALGVPNALLGEAVGQLYVEKHFPKTSKDKMLELVGNLKTALGQHIKGLTWMSDTTKQRALEKLDAFTVKIGYPDKWRDYSSLKIDRRRSYWDNIKDAIKHEIDYNLADWGKPVDKTRWYMTPQTVNAYYSPLSNEICFPAGILQAPYFNPDADPAENYGAIGVVIGHEMTHGFDDQGSQFDKDGNFANWWTEADKEKFESLTSGLAEQFDNIIVLGDTHANGRFTLGENIADQGGLRVAYTAYHNSLGDSEGKVIDGFTPDQRFYLSYANVWAGNIRDEEILLRTKTDPHSLGRWRVNGSLRNIEPFFKAFDIKDGDAMYLAPDKRVIIW
ncbi:M13 family peptidase [Barnesiella sp. WM24]|uniref:M13 family metallopeptidase n=1 Tax=Barnesiella sp. WM24 TaxID=2558278 RepID=UPI0010721477|nr:M13 family peptidase [Barnesiella sp. WM24]